MLPAPEVVVRSRTGGRTAEAFRTMGSGQDQAVVEAKCTTVVASRSNSDSWVVQMLVVDSARTSTLLAGSSQLAAVVQRSRHVADPLQLRVWGSAATLQVPVPSEKSARVQSKPKLKSLVVAAVADSA